MVRSKVENGPCEVTEFLPQEAPSIPEKPSLVSPQGRDRRPQKHLWKSPKHKILLVVKQGSAVVSTRTSGWGGILILVIKETINYFSAGILAPASWRARSSVAVTSIKELEHDFS